MNSKRDLFEHLQKGTRVLQDPLVKQAFEKIDRADFVPDKLRDEAYEDYPLPIGFGQTISQPTTVAFMFGLLGVKPGMKVLDVGSGSGWTIALLAEIVGDKGEVYGVERIPELAEFGRSNLKRYDFPHAEIFDAGERLGLPERAPFDRILVSAAGDRVPEELEIQLASEGVMVVPVRDSIVRVQKHIGGSQEEKVYPGFAFVPLVH